jgi:GGDEF domain-containing protein
VSPQQAYEILEGIRLAVAAHPWSNIAPGLQVTISIGGAWHPGDGPSISQRKFLSTADRHLYAAKHTGRNRVVHDLPVDSGTVPDASDSSRC